MKSNTFLRAAFLALALAAAGSCSSDPVNQKELLYGRWEIDGATRNGAPTQSLDGLYFEFREDGSMDTNLPVASGESRFEMEGNSLRQFGGPTEIEYFIQQLEDTTMVLSTELRSTNFRFSLKKRNQVQ